ncbi:MAG: hypothetical protein KAT16_10060 [Candidatus Heimdallarchaeota archaeon]|nr:hypothetical protein [Candidatus Heimdallarchaeota archaeon]
MSLRELLDKFADGFSVIGIFVQTSKELFPVVQENPNLFLALKRTHLLKEGINELEINNATFGLIVDTLNDEIRIIIVTSLKNIHETHSHWNRFAPVIREKIELEDFILQESLETRLLNRLEDIRIAIEDSLTIFKEKTENV